MTIIRLLGILEKPVRDDNLQQVHATLPARNGSHDGCCPSRDLSIHHMPFPAASPLEPSFSISKHFQDFRLKHNEQIHRHINERTHTHTHQQTR